ncbi:MAG: hypothetical protein WKF83_10865 [Nocardioidaceae bacterium]
MADESASHVGDVVGHRDVERRLHTAVLVCRDRLEQVVERVGKSLVVGLVPDLLRGLPRDPTALGQRRHHHRPVRRSERHDLVPHLARQEDPVTVAGLPRRLHAGDQRVLAVAEEPDGLVEAQGVVDVAQADLEDGTATPTTDRLPGRRGHPESQQQRAYLTGERCRRRGQRGHPVGHRPVGLEQAGEEARVHLDVVGLQDRRRDARCPALAGVVDPGQHLGEPCGLPPARQAHRGQRDLLVSLLRLDVRLEVEQTLGQDTEPLDDVEVGVSDTQPDALGVQASVAHEVADELGQLGRHRRAGPRCWRSPV